MCSISLEFSPWPSLSTEVKVHVLHTADSSQGMEPTRYHLVIRITVCNVETPSIARMAWVIPDITGELPCSTPSSGPRQWTASLGGKHTFKPHFCASEIPLRRSILLSPKKWVWEEKRPHWNSLEQLFLALVPFCFFHYSQERKQIKSEEIQISSQSRSSRQFELSAQQKLLPKYKLGPGPFNRACVETHPQQRQRHLTGKILTKALDSLPS